VNDQSVYLVAGTDVQATVDADSFSESLAALTLDELRSKIAKAEEAVEAGTVKPQTPFGGT
jgi:hypothetical protein